jgi:hypothetical protein
MQILQHSSAAFILNADGLPGHAVVPEGVGPGIMFGVEIS